MEKKLAKPIPISNVEVLKNIPPCKISSLRYVYTSFDFSNQSGTILNHVVIQAGVIRGERGPVPALAAQPRAQQRGRGPQGLYPRVAREREQQRDERHPRLAQAPARPPPPVPEAVRGRGGGEGGQGRGRRRGGGGGLGERRLETTPFADTLGPDHHTIPGPGAGEGQATGDRQRRVPVGQVRGELRVERRTSRTFAGKLECESSSIFRALVSKEGTEGEMGQYPV